LRYYPANDFNAPKNVCIFEWPEKERRDLIPDYIYHQSSNIKPSLMFLPSNQKIDKPHEKNITFFSSWYNFIKVIELLYDENIDKFQSSPIVMMNINVGNEFISSSVLFEN
jgi:hypothetical protein